MDTPDLMSFEPLEPTYEEFVPQETVETASPSGGADESLDTAEHQVDSSQGVNLVEEKSPDRIVAHNAVHANTRAERHLNDSSWSLDKMLNRKTLVDTLTWNLTDAVGHNIATYDVIQDLLRQDIVSQPFLRFQQWRAKSIKIHATVIGTRYFSGRLLMAFQPTQVPKSHWLNVPTLDQLVTMQHAFLNPSAGTTTEFNIPFNLYKGWLDLEKGDALGQLSLVVYNPLLSAVGGPNSVQIKVFLSIDGSEFKIPRSGGATYIDMLKREIAKYEVRKVSAQSGIFAGVGKDIDDLVGTIIPGNLVGDLLGALLDKPQVSTPPELKVVKDQGYLSHGVSVDFVEKLQLDPTKQQFCDKEHFASDTNALMLDSLIKQRISRVTTLNWPSTSAVGTQLFKYSVGPLPERIPTTPFPVSLMSYFSMNFGFWRGAIDFIFDVVATPFHEGRIDITYHPNRMTIPTDYNTAMSQYLASFNIRNGQNCMRVRFPCLSETPWKIVWSGQTLSDTDSESHHFSDYFSGTFAVWVSAPLRAPTTVAANVSINIFTIAGDDYQLNTPTFYNNSLTPVGFPTTISGGAVADTRTVIIDSDSDIEIVPRLRSRRIQAQSGSATKSAPLIKPAPTGTDATKTASKKTNPSYDLNKTPQGQVPVYAAPSGGRISDPKVHHFGETYTDLRELLKRYQHTSLFPISSPAIPAPALADIASGARPLMYAIDLSDLSGGDPFTNYGIGQNNILGRLVRPFRNFRGPLCFKLKVHTKVPNVSVNNQPWGYVSYLPSTNIDTTTGTGGNYVLIQDMASAFPNALVAAPRGYLAQTSMPMARFSSTQVAEFEIPFSYLSSTALITNYENLSTQYNNYFYTGTLMLAIYNPQLSDSALNSFVELQVSFGDETHVGTFIGIPLIRKIGATTAFPDKW